MDTQKIYDLIDKAIDKKGPLRVPAYWMRRVLRSITGLIDEVIVSLYARIDSVEKDAKNTKAVLDSTANLVSKIYDNWYLTFTALDDDFSLSFSGYGLEYKLDGGDWTELTGSTPSINYGQRVMLRGERGNDVGSEGIGTFIVRAKCKVGGSVMSLLYKDDIGRLDIQKPYTFKYLFKQATSITEVSRNLLPATTLASGCYQGMFYGCTSLVNAPELPATTLVERCYYEMFDNCRNLVNAPEVKATKLASYCCMRMFNYCRSLVNAPELPATKLASYCYKSMFSGCTSLTTAPELPATTLAYECYNNMFYDCTSLVNAPEQLPATTLASGCYSHMFDDCTSLVNAPEQLPATTLVDNCYSVMFKNCTSLVTAPELPATTLASGCYSYMFKSCKKLVNAPELPATTLVDNCYEEMFYGCTSLVNAPELPATELMKGCYNNMFGGCTNLVTAPELPANTLITDCYRNMFIGCTKLSYIKAMFTMTPSITYTQDWVKGVAPTGTFVKNAAAKWNVTGPNGVPEGWTVETATA